MEIDRCWWSAHARHATLDARLSVSPSREEAASNSQYVELGAALTLAIIERRRNLMRAQHSLLSSGMDSTMDGLQHFYYSEFRHLPEGMQLCAAMDDEKNDTDDGLAEHCVVCGQRGFLICCDRCTDVYHLSCVSLKVVPDGDWFCPSCQQAGQCSSHSISLRPSSASSIGHAVMESCTKRKAVRSQRAFRTSDGRCYKYDLLLGRVQWSNRPL